VTVRIEKAGPIWTVVHSRYDQARNTMDPATADQLTQAFLDFDADREAAVAVLWERAARSARAGISSPQQRCRIATASTRRWSKAWPSRKAPPPHLEDRSDRLPRALEARDRRDRRSRCRGRHGAGASVRHPRCG
jgi:hypothetical protein